MAGLDREERGKGGKAFSKSGDRSQTRSVRRRGRERRVLWVSSLDGGLSLVLGSGKNTIRFELPEPRDS